VNGPTATIVAPDLGKFDVVLKPYARGWAGEVNGRDFIVAVYINPRRKK
jgi:hypothetical protein